MDRQAVQATKYFLVFSTMQPDLFDVAKDVFSQIL